MLTLVLRATRSAQSLAPRTSNQAASSTQTPDISSSVRHGNTAQNETETKLITVVVTSVAYNSSHLSSQIKLKPVESGHVVHTPTPLVEMATPTHATLTQVLSVTLV